MTKTDTNIRVELVKTNKSLLGETEITNGCVWFVDDTKELFFDFDSKRSEVKDILVLQQEAERTSILFAPLNKFYFVLETQVLWFYKDGSWYKVSPDLSVFYTKAEIDSLIYGYLRLRNVTYSELVDLKANNQLESGVYYRITDYVTTTNGTSADSNEPSRSAGHPFDIIVRAIGPSDLSELGNCVLHENDTYFANQNLGAWQVWYDINNDTTKYTWADTENGKGVIYRMIDENHNDLPYDFKNIQFYRDKTLDKYANFTDRMTAEDGYYYTFCDTTTSPVSDYSVTSSKGIYNTTMGTDSLKVPKLNNILFLFGASHKYSSDVNIGLGTYNCTFSHAHAVDIKGGGSYNIYVAGNMDGVSIGGGCYNISSKSLYSISFKLLVILFKYLSLIVHIGVLLTLHNSSSNSLSSLLIKILFITTP